MKRSVPFVYVAIAAPILLTAASCNKPVAVGDGANPTNATNGPALDRVTAAPPVRKTLELFTTQPGKVEAIEETPLYPKFSGFVKRVNVDIGDSVKKDQVLITLSIPEMLDELKQKEWLVVQAKAEVNQAEAAVQSARAAAETAQARVAQAEAGIGRAAGEYDRRKSEYERMRQLAENDSVTRKLVDEALNQLRASEATREENDMPWCRHQRLSEGSHSECCQSRGGCGRCRGETTSCGCESQSNSDVIGIR